MKEKGDWDPGIQDLAPYRNFGGGGRGQDAVRDDRLGEASDREGQGIAGLKVEMSVSE